MAQIGGNPAQGMTGIVGRGRTTCACCTNCILRVQYQSRFDGFVSPTRTLNYIKTSCNTYKLGTRTITYDPFSTTPWSGTLGVQWGMIRVTGTFMRSDGATVPLDIYMMSVDCETYTASIVTLPGNSYAVWNSSTGTWSGNIAIPAASLGGCVAGPIYDFSFGPTPGTSAGWAAVNSPDAYPCAPFTWGLEDITGVQECCSQTLDFSGYGAIGTCEGWNGGATNVTCGGETITITSESELDPNQPGLLPCACCCFNCCFLCCDEDGTSNATVTASVDGSPIGEATIPYVNCTPDLTGSPLGLLSFLISSFNCRESTVSAGVSIIYDLAIYTNYVGAPEAHLDCDLNEDEPCGSPVSTISVQLSSDNGLTFKTFVFTIAWDKGCYTCMERHLLTRTYSYLEDNAGNVISCQPCDDDVVAITNECVYDPDCYVHNWTEVGTTAVPVPVECEPTPVSGFTAHAVQVTVVYWIDTGEFCEDCECESESETPAYTDCCPICESPVYITRHEYSATFNACLDGMGGISGCVQSTGWTGADTMVGPGCGATLPTSAWDVTAPTPTTPGGGGCPVGYTYYEFTVTIVRYTAGATCTNAFDSWPAPAASPATPSLGCVCALLTTTGASGSCP